MASSKSYTPTTEELTDAIDTVIKEKNGQKSLLGASTVRREIENENPSWKLKDRSVSKILKKKLKQLSTGDAANDGGGGGGGEDGESISSSSSASSRARRMVKTASLSLRKFGSKSSSSAPLKEVSSSTKGSKKKLFNKAKSTSAISTKSSDMQVVEIPVETKALLPALDAEPTDNQEEEEEADDVQLLVSSPTKSDQATAATAQLSTEEVDTFEEKEVTDAGINAEEETAKVEEQPKDEIVPEDINEAADRSVYADTDDKKKEGNCFEGICAIL